MNIIIEGRIYFTGCVYRLNVYLPVIHEKE